MGSANEQVCIAYCLNPIEVQELVPQKQAGLNMDLKFGRALNSNRQIGLKGNINNESFIIYILNNLSEE